MLWLSWACWACAILERTEWSTKCGAQRFSVRNKHIPICKMSFGWLCCSVCAFPVCCSDETAPMATYSSRHPPRLPHTVAQQGLRCALPYAAMLPGAAWAGVCRCAGLQSGPAWSGREISWRAKPCLLPLTYAWPGASPICRAEGWQARGKNDAVPVWVWIYSVMYLW